jgi:hypothetical protein
VETTSIGEGRATRETSLAVFVRLETGDERWIPKKVISDDSEVQQLGDSGDVVVAQWWAKREGLA